MIPKSIEKYINSLKQKKYRERHQAFLAEGEKVVTEFINEKWKTEKICALPEWLERNTGRFSAGAAHAISLSDMGRITALQSPSPVLAVFRNKELPAADRMAASSFYLLLDGINDPGNLGTIIRIADWFGLKAVYCSENCADAFNPKVVQASMGSLARIPVVYTPLPEWIRQHPGIPVYGTSADGISMKEMIPPDYGSIIIGSESHGISAEVQALVSRYIAIPRFGAAESLNAAVATGILCSWLKKVW